MTFWIALALILFGVVGGTWAIVILVATALFETAETFVFLRHSQRRRVQVGVETLLGRVVEVAAPCRPHGHVRVQGELWRAHCPEGADPGDRVRIVGLEGLTLEVAREP